MMRVGEILAGLFGEGAPSDPRAAGAGGADRAAFESHWNDVVRRAFERERDAGETSAEAAPFAPAMLDRREPGMPVAAPAAESPAPDAASGGGDTLPIAGDESAKPHRADSGEPPVPIPPASTRDSSRSWFDSPSGVLGAGQRFETMLAGPHGSAPADPAVAAGAFDPVAPDLLSTGSLAPSTGSGGSAPRPSLPAREGESSLAPPKDMSQETEPSGEGTATRGERSNAESARAASATVGNVAMSAAADGEPKPTETRDVAERRGDGSAARSGETLETEKVDGRGEAGDIAPIGLAASFDGSGARADSDPGSTETAARGSERGANRSRSPREEGEAGSAFTGALRASGAGADDAASPIAATIRDASSPSPGARFDSVLPGAHPTPGIGESAAPAAEAHARESSGMPAASGGADGPADARGEVLLGALSRRIAEGIASGKRELIVRLSPPSLGHLRIRFHLDEEGSTGARIAVTDPTVHRLLEANRSDLRLALREHGIELNDLSLLGQGLDAAPEREHSGYEEADRAPRAHPEQREAERQDDSSVSSARRRPPAGLIDISV